MKFISKYKNLRMVLKSSKQIMVENSVVTVPGQVVQFENYEYETEDKAEIKAIKASKAFGIDVYADKEEKAGA